MDAFLLPIGGDRYALYCEPADDDLALEEEPDDGAGDGPGLKARLIRYVRGVKAYFREMLIEAERERLEGRLAEEGDPSWVARIRRPLMRWIVERIAEQRLLWRLRRAEDARLQHPEDVDGARAMEVLRAMLKKDSDRHVKRLAVHSVLFVASGVFFFIPGPNIIAYYFAFCAVGHYLSWRGAQRGLSDVTWGTHASQALSVLRQAITLPASQRGPRVDEVARELGLEHLPSFMERMAVTAK